MTRNGLTRRDIRRENDWAPDERGELVGLLLPADDGRWGPATVFGAALGPAVDEARAETLVREQGLSSPAERWWVRTGGATWREAWLLEVKSDRVRVTWSDPCSCSPARASGSGWRTSRSSATNRLTLFRRLVSEISGFSRI
jgi:hypothetical protein